MERGRQPIRLWNKASFSSAAEWSPGSSGRKGPLTGESRPRGNDIDLLQRDGGAILIIGAALQLLLLLSGLYCY